jgi:hypothetical protein
LQRKLKEWIKSTPMWERLLRPVRDARDVDEWLVGGRPVPPPHGVKARNLLCLADLFGIDTLVETGTFRGDMISATKKRFRKIYSIEVFEPLASAASAKFSNDKNVEIINADSSDALPALLPRIIEPVVFWLDGHYSGPGTGKGRVETPILKEILAIKAVRDGSDVIVIDDAQAFGSDPAFPSLDSFLVEVSTAFGTTPRVANDSIFVLPNSRRVTGTSRLLKKPWLWLI